MIANKLSECPPKKYIIAIRGDKNVGKTTTINKIYFQLFDSGKINDIKYPGRDKDEPDPNKDKPDRNNPTKDFFLTGTTTSYGLTGFVSEGDQIKYLRLRLSKISNANVIICACRKYGPCAFKAVEEMAEKGYNIIWKELPKPLDEKIINKTISDVTELF